MGKIVRISWKVPVKVCLPGDKSFVANATNSKSQIFFRRRVYQLHWTLRWNSYRNLAANRDCAHRLLQVII